MLIPQYWAEGRRVGQTREGRQVTVRRFGWSTASQDDAERMAGERAEEALARIVQGDDLPRRERKTAYNGADGVPIREEVLERLGDCVITRNVYGAQCLNVPNVLFVDLDDEVTPPYGLSCFFMLALTASLTALVWTFTESPCLAFAVGFVILVASYPLLQSIFRMHRNLRGGFAGQVRRRIERFLRNRQDWHLRLYRTPGGFRILVLHRTFDTDDPEVAECFTAFGADPMYARMCFRQKCFRARLTAKPWRLGLSTLRPRRGVWPIAADRMPERIAWVAEYEEKAGDYAACRFVEAFGTGGVDPAAEFVRKLHDDRSRALTDLPLA